MSGRNLLLLGGVLVLLGLGFSALKLIGGEEAARVPPAAASEAPLPADRSLAPEHTIKAGPHRLEVQLAVSLQEQALGLSYIPSIGEDEGMLFLNDSPRPLSFWMKGMHFPIDIIWLSGEGKVVDITRDARPDGYPEERFSPKVEAQHVLEVNAGWAERHGLKIGDIVEIPDIPGAL